MFIAIPLQWTTWEVPIISLERLVASGLCGRQTFEIVMHGPLNAIFTNCVEKGVKNGNSSSINP
jgi:hypothetical protein